MCKKHNGTEPYRRQHKTRQISRLPDISAANYRHALKMAEKP